ncbi:DUF3352 domain-containing protein [Candidatus Parcubacteria bacterium]|nr:DUF3352 domain-containing protein [Candidatus Parcubacteria bacterium]
MLNQELLSYIQKQFSKNIGKDKVRQALLSAGWPIVDIETAFSELESKNKQNPQTEQPKPALSQQELEKMVRENPDYYYFPPKKESPKAPDEKKDIEKIFQQGVAKKTVEGPNFISKNIEPFQIKKTDLPKTGNPIAKIILGIAIIAIAIVCVYLYFYWQEIKDPLSLVPENSNIVLELNIDPLGSQVKQLEKIIQRIPFTETNNQSINNTYELVKNDDFFKSILDNYSQGKIKNVIGFLNSKTNKMGIIIPGLSLEDSRISNQAKNFFKKTFGDFESEKYKDVEIIEIYNQTIDYGSYYINQNAPLKEKKVLALAYAGVGDNLALSNDLDQVKNIIDNYKKMNLAAIFSKSSAKNIRNSESFKKLEKYLPKDYLAYIYSDIDFEKINALSIKENFKDSSIVESLAAALKNSKTTQDGKGMISYIKAQDYGFQTRSYLSGFSKGLGNKFNISKSLASQLPSEINGNQVVFYVEGNGLDKIFDYLISNYDAYQKDDIEQLWPIFEQRLGINVEKTIKNIDGQFAIQMFYDPQKPEGKNFYFVFSGQSSDASKVEQAVSFKNLYNSIQLSEAKEKEAYIISSFSGLRAYAEIYYSNKGFYPLYIQGDSQMNKASQNIEKQNPESEFKYNSSYKSYCAYAQLIAKDMYYCVDSSGNTGIFSSQAMQTACSQKNYKCPTVKAVITDDLYALLDSAIKEEEINGTKVQAIKMPSGTETSFARKGDIVYFSFGGENAMEDILNDSGKKISDSQELKSISFENKSSIYSLSFLKPVSVLMAAMQVRQMISTADSGIMKIYSSFSEIFPIISNYSYDEKGIVSGNSKIEIKDIGQTKLKSLEDDVNKYLRDSSLDNYGDQYKPLSTTSSIDSTETLDSEKYQDSGDNYTY